MHTRQLTSSSHAWTRAINGRSLCAMLRIGGPVFSNMAYHVNWNFGRSAVAANTKLCHGPFWRWCDLLQTNRLRPHSLLWAATTSRQVHSQFDFQSCFILHFLSYPSLHCRRSKRSWLRSEQKFKLNWHKWEQKQAYHRNQQLNLLQLQVPRPICRKYRV